MPAAGPRIDPLSARELRVPPPVVALVAAGLMAVAARFAPGFVFDVPGGAVLAAAVAAAGLAFDAAALVAFLRARTTINPTKPGSTSSIVTGGVYRVTRNPMYVGLVLVLAGFALYLGNALGFLTLPAVVLYLGRFQIGPEERVLAAKFGAAYDDYRSRVRRWL